jgi:16S rRNA (cytosine1402-N4)-methyltransferase
MDVVHIPVLLEDVIRNLVSEKTRLFVDATIGGGGHSYHILERYGTVRLIGLDADEVALKNVRARLRAFEDRVRLIRGNFRDLKETLNSAGVLSVDAVLFDLGLSTLQIMGKRGFSFNDETFLDMRMDNGQALTGHEVVNDYSYKDLLRIIRDYGEEYRGPAIVRAIVETRKKRRIDTAKELADLVLRVKKRTGKIHPATKTFQAIRIEVNDELKSLEAGIAQAVDMLAPGGRVGVISFHSLEDRIVKNAFRSWPALDVVTKKPIRAELAEIRENPSSRSAKFRVAERK